MALFVGAETLLSDAGTIADDGFFHEQLTLSGGIPMVAAFKKTVLYRTCAIVQKLISLKAAALIVAFGTLAYAGQVTIFLDDFEDDVTGGNPNPPPIGEPWHISEVVGSGINVEAGVSDPLNNVLRFGPYRNMAVAPFSPIDVQRLRTLQNATVSFDYYGLSSSEYGHFFDIGGFDGISDNPAFMIRIDPQKILGFHDLYYLDPGGGLVDSGLDVAANTIQSISISIDFAADNYQLDVEGNSTALLPLLACPSDIHGIQFSNYGVAMGSGSIDNLSVTLTAPENPEVLNPEPAAIVLLAIGALCAMFLWFLGSKKSSE